MDEVNQNCQDLPGAQLARLREQKGFSQEYVAARLHLRVRLIQLLEEDRYAYFECCIVLASPEGVKKCVRGICEGTLLLQEKGGGGFGYDPLFIKHGYSKTFAELEETIKNRISHRRKALDKLLTALESIFPS